MSVLCGPKELSLIGKVMQLKPLSPGADAGQERGGAALLQVKRMPVHLALSASNLA